MQEIHRISGGSRLIGDGADGDWRIKQNHRNVSRQLLKCPRCDSGNTKFCYYNNYNLSQPRHYCKNCRRYWTEGGILRSVPVGGGCRKKKRSRTKNSSKTPEPMIITPNSDYHSSLDCKSEPVSAPTLNSPVNLTSAAQPKNLPLLIADLPERFSDGELFSNFSEGFQIGFSNFSGVSPFQLSQQAQNNLWWPQSFIGIADEDELSVPEMIAGFFDRTVEVEAELPDLHSIQNTEFGSFDYKEFGRLDFFDSPRAVDRNYWNDPHRDLPTVVNSQS